MQGIRLRADFVVQRACGALNDIGEPRLFVCVSSWLLAFTSSELE